MYVKINFDDIISRNINLERGHHERKNSNIR